MSERLGNVLLIDDERVDQMIYRRVLKKSGLVDNITGFEYADEALAHLRQPDCPTYDVIFLDINMPRMNGFEFLDAAFADERAKSYARAVIVMLTTSIEKRDKERAAQYAVVKDFINKPLTVEHVQRVAEILGEQARG